MNIEIVESSEIEPNLRTEIEKRVQREFGHVEIVRSHKWADPTWTFLGYEKSELVSVLSIVDRQGEVDRKPLRLFGINNVITEPNHRGKGYSKQLNQSALDFIKAKDTEALGVLFCADNLLPFYASLGWKKFSGKTTIWQPPGEKAWESNCMTYSFGDTVPRKEIHLKGLPW